MGGRRRRPGVNETVKARTLERERESNYTHNACTHHAQCLCTCAARTHAHVECEFVDSHAVPIAGCASLCRTAPHLEETGPECMQAYVSCVICKATCEGQYIVNNCNCMHTFTRTACISCHGLYACNVIQMHYKYMYIYMYTLTVSHAHLIHELRV